MPRQGRKISASDVYHVIIRGNDRQNLFYEDTDREIFKKRLKETKEKFKFKIYAYCLMHNHVHLIIKINYNDLSKMMNSLESRYSQYLNRKLERSGHLFENRFYSKAVGDAHYFIRVCKYVHRNPEKADIEKTEKYKWSSYQEYFKSKKEIVEKEALMHYFENNLEKLKEYTLDNDDDTEILKYSDFEIKSKLNDNEVNDILCKRYKLKNSIEISSFDENKKAQIIGELKDLEGTGISQISRVTRVPVYWIKKFWKQI